MKICNEKECIGCMNCFNKCPSKAIEVKKDGLGFSYPKINLEKCIKCGLCKRVCPIISKSKNVQINKCYACKNKDKEIVKKSSSGGIFYLLAKKILDEKGVLYGAVYDGIVKHRRVDNIIDLDPLLGSKYVQSDLNEIFQKLEEDLKNNRLVLFVGTPCQNSALKCFLNKEYNTLFQIDFICHGVGSPKVFKKHINSIEKQIGKVKKVSFRNKNNNWIDFNFSAEGKKTYIKSKMEDLYLKSFLRNLCLRESCYSCNFKSKNRVSDITLGDFWQIEKIHKDFYDELGVSAIILNTSKGEKIFNEIISKIDILEVSYKEISDNNIGLENSALMNSHRKEYIKKINEIENLEEIKEEYYSR